MIKPVNRMPMYEEIANQMIFLIKNKRWKAEEQLPSETELAKAFGVSRNSIREALKYLSIIGIIYAHPGQGTFITKDALKKVENTELINVISEKSSASELLETRLIIEPQLAGLAALRAIARDKKNLESTYQILKDDLITRINILNEKENNKEAELDKLKINPTNYGLRFHMCVAEIARNKVLAKFLKSIESELEWQRSWIYFKDNKEILIMLHDHENIYNAIITNNQKKAIKAMHEHLLHVYENVETLK